ncbi:MAG: YbhB/YbcL family Raf kinase inhibitor-like protein [Actinomycetota bacterium]
MRSPVRRPFLISVVVLSALSGLAAGCARDGRDLAATQSWQTTTTRPPPPTFAPDREDSPTGLSLSSPLFEPGGEIPVSATCAGDNVFPDLTWGEVDPSAAELVVALADQTDPEIPVLMWLMAGIPPTLTGLEAGVMPIGAFETTDDYGITGYGEPCLESYASGTRDLQFRIYVLAEPSNLTLGHPGNEAWAQVKNQAIDSASLLARAFNDG